MIVETQPLLIAEESLRPVAAAPAAVRRDEITVTVTSRLAEVESIWRGLTAGPQESPGQSYDFIRLWVETRAIPEAAQRYVVGWVGNEPVALWPLHRKRVRGVRVFTWFPGANVGCYTPVADMDRLAGLGILGRSLLWRAMASQLSGADLVYLRSIPIDVGAQTGLFDELGMSLPVETLYRAHFSSWEECDRLQRSKSRRKHDRQQGDRLNALGEVEFKLVTDPAEAHVAIATMFEQRSARFRAQGIRDTFVIDDLIGFYHAAAEAGSGVDVRLHVLRLNGDIVAVRYNVVVGDRMFCLISSMSDDPVTQGGSPGKQCLLRVMQSVFEDGFTVFDMGSGFTDEKRHWCNEQLPLRQHYIGLSPQGAAIIEAHRAFQRLRAWAKSNQTLKSGLRGLQQTVDRLTGKSQAKAETPPPAEH